MAMRVEVDYDLCEGHAKCVKAAPAVFVLNDDEQSVVLLDPVPDEYVEGVERAVRVCPRAAIAIVER